MQRDKFDKLRVVWRALRPFQSPKLYVKSFFKVFVETPVLNFFVGFLRFRIFVTFSDSNLSSRQKDMQKVQKS